MQGVLYEGNRDKNGELTIFIGENYNFHPHLHKNIEILYILEGEIEVDINDHTFVAKTDDIVFIDRYNKHSITALTQYKKYVLSVPLNECNDILLAMGDKTIKNHLDDKSFNMSLLPFFEGLKRDYKKSLLYKRGYVDLIIGNIISHYKLIKDNSSRNEIIVRILEYIDKNYKSDLSLDAISEKFGYSKYYFSKLFNKYMNDNLNNYVNTIRAQYAHKRIQMEESDSITFIAYDCGFNSMTTFYRFYKKIYNMTPKIKKES